MKQPYRSYPLLAVFLVFGIILLTLKIGMPKKQAGPGASMKEEVTELSAKPEDKIKEALAKSLKEREIKNFDKRLEGKPAPALSDRQRLAVEALRKEVPDVQVDFDALLGSPKYVVSTSRFLTQSQPSLMQRPLSYEEAMAKVKAYVGMHRALFPHGPAALDAGFVTRKDTTEATGLQTVVWEQRAVGLPVYRSVFKANLSKSGEIMTIASQFMPDAEAAAAGYVAAHPGAPAAPAVSVEKAVSLAAGAIGKNIAPELITKTTSPNLELRAEFFSALGLSSSWAEKVWLPMDAATVRLAWEVTVESPTDGMFTVLVDAETGNALLRQSLTFADATPQYRVWTGDSPTPMSPGFSKASDATALPPLVARELVQLESINSTASPNGWIPTGGTTTTGNNVDAYTDRNGDDAADAGSRPTGTGTDSRTFDFTINLAQDPSTHTAGTVTQLFYRCNWLHDQFYSLGFTETFGNFQTNNFGRNGNPATDPGDTDAVRAEAQDAANPSAIKGRQSNNANFSVPKDGFPPRMQMYVYDGPSPIHDGSLDSQVVIHEYAHGVSNRLVGGGVLIFEPVTRGMGEGWSDFFCLAMMSKPNDDPHASYPRATYNSYQNPIYSRDSSGNVVVTGNLNSSYYWGNRSYPYFADPSPSVSANTVNPLTFKDIDPNQPFAHASFAMNPRFNGVRTADSVHNMGEVWCMMLWEARARLVDRYGLSAGNQTILQLVIDGMKNAPADPNFVQARNGILQADLNNNGGANLHMLWNAFAKRGLGNGATAPASSSSVGVVENFTVPASIDATAPVVTFSPLVDQQAIFEFTGTGPQAVGGTVNESCAVTFGIVEYNTGSTPNRYWNGSTWVTDAAAAGTKLAATVSGNNWSPAAGVVLPLSADLRNGFYLLNVRAVDIGGNIKENGIVVRRTVSAETTLPLVQITSPTHNSTIAALNSVTGTASDPAGGSGLTGAVTLTIYHVPTGEYWTGTAWSATQATVGANVAANGTWQCTLLPGGPNARTGQFSVSAAAYDWAGNVSVPQSGVTNLFFTVDPPVDTTKPLVQITSPYPTGTTRTAVTQISGTASDTGGSGLTRYVTLTIYQDGDYWNGTSWTATQVALDAPVENGTWVYDQMPTGGNVRAGQYSVSAASHDYAGNVSLPQSGVTNLFFSIDAAPPTGSITAPANGGSFPTFPAFSGTANDSGGISYVVCYLRRNRDWKYWTGSEWVADPGQAPLAATYNSGNNTFSGNFTLPTVGVNAIGGSYNYIAIPVDVAGNHSQYDSNVIITYHATFTWTGASPAANNLWDDPENWSSILPEKIFTPGMEDIAVINSGAPAALPGETLDCYDLHLTGGTLTANTVNVFNVFQMSGGTFNGTLNLTASSLSNWTTGTIIGALNVRQGATLEVQGGNASKILGVAGQPAIVNNEGIIRFLTAAGDTSVARIQGWNYQGGNPTINNKPTGVMEIDGDGSPLTHYQYTGMDFINEGRIVKTSGTGTTLFDSFWLLDNKTGGIIESMVPQGTIQFSNAVPVTFRSGTILRGPGTVRLAGNEVNAPAGTWNVDGAGTLLVNGSTIAGPQTGSLTLAHSADAAVRWLSGLLHGNFTIPSGALFTVEGDYGDKQLGQGGLPAILTNEGIIRCVVTGGNTEVAKIKGWNYQGGNPTINNMDHARFEIAGPGSPLSHYQYTTMVFNNRGRIIKTAGAGTTSWNPYWDLRNEPGALVENALADSTFEFASGTATFKDGSIFYGPGTIRFGAALITAESGAWERPGGVTLLFDGMTLACPQTGALTLPFYANSPLRWRSGTIHGNLTIPENVILTVEGEYSNKWLGDAGKPAVLDNFGTIRCTVTAPNTEVARIIGWNYQGGNPTINNKPSGVFEIEGDGIPLWHYQNTAMFFNNEGRIVKTAGTGVTNWNSYWSLDNAAGGVIESAVPAGTVRFATPVTTLLQSGTILRGPGTLLMAGGTITGPAGTWTVDTSGALVLAGATIEAPQEGSLTLVPGLTWQSGIIHGNMTVPVGSTLNVEGGYSDKQLGNSSKPAVLDNLGTIRFRVADGNSEVARIIGWNYQGGNPTINNKPAGVMEIEGDGSPLWHYQNTAMFFNNEGRIVKTAGTGVTNWNSYWSLANATGGVIESAVPAGTVRFATPVTTLLRSGTLLRGPGTLLMAGGTITGPAGTWTVDTSGALVLAGATIEAPQEGSLSLVPGLTWQSGTIHGNVTVPAGATLKVEGGYSDKYLGASSLPAVLDNFGTIRFAVTTPNAEVARITGWNYQGGHPTINNKPSGILEIEGDGSPLTHYQFTAMFFNNEGRIVKTAGTGVTNWNSYWSLDNAAGGVIESAVSAGTVRFATPVTTLLRSGTILRGPGTLLMAGGVITGVSGTWAMDISGALVLDGATIEAPQVGSLTLVPGLTWLSGIIHGNVTVPFGATLNVEGGYGDKRLGDGAKPAVLENLGTIRFRVAVGNSEVARITGWNYQGGNPTIINGVGGVFSIEGDGTPLTSYQYTNMSLQNAGIIVKAAGSGAANLNGYWPLTNSGTLAADIGTLDLNVPVSFNQGTRIEGTATSHCRIVGNTTTVQGTSTIASGRLVLTGGAITGHADGTGILEGGVFDWSEGVIHGILRFGATANVTVTGTAVKVIGTNATLNNAGNLTWSGGNILGSGSSTFNNLAGGTFNAPASGYFDHSGGGSKTFTNSGTLNIGASPGLLTFSSPWAFTQTASGLLNIEMGGTSAAQFDRLAIGGSATLGGTLNVTLLNGYVPTLDDNFPVMTYGSRTGEFAIFNSPGAYFSRNYDAGNLTLTVTNAPSTLAEWKAAYFAPGSPESASNADPDGDGLSNFAEYVFNTNPLAASPVPQEAAVETIEGQRWLTLGYRRWANPEADGVIYTPQAGSGLGDWGTLGIIDEVDPDALVIPGSTACRCRVLIDSNREFLRVQATKP